MSDTYHAVIPYESMDPLAIGATDDESKKHRDTLTLDIPTANLVAAVYPDEPAPVGDSTRGGAPCARRAVRRPDVRGAPRREAERRGRDRQPVPPRLPRRSSSLRCSTRSRRPASPTSASSARTARSSPCPRRTWSRRSAPPTSRAWRRTAGPSTRTTRRTRTPTPSSASRPAGRRSGSTRRSRRAT